MSDEALARVYGREHREKLQELCQQIERDLKPFFAKNLVFQIDADQFDQMYPNCSAVVIGSVTVEPR